MSERAANQTVIQLAVLGGAFFIGYKLLTAALSKVKDGAEAVGGAAGDVIARWIHPAPINVLGKFVIQGSNEVVSPNQYPMTYIASNRPEGIPYGGKIPTIVVRGARYILGPRDLNGNWPAVLLNQVNI